MGYNSVTGLAAEVAALQKELETMCSGLDALVNNIEGQWEGAAQKEFMKAYRKLKPKLKTVSEALENYTMSIGKVPSHELSTEKKTSRNFTSF